MKKKKNSKRHIIIDTPCSAPDVEAFLHIVSHEGHWHDAVVRGELDKIVIEFEDDRIENGGACHE